MAAPSGPLAERGEIHKSCKSLESVVNILNDYCEAANAIVLLQKKLAKALREAASAKCVAEIPANALTASATIFEAMADVDTKFAKFADKECDSLSAEVKKWFKKLAKEERAHDEKIASANLKIKQAGQLYERKAKRNPRDAADEHTRYINLLSTLGPEVNREKYNHALLVTQKHTSAMYNLGSCLARVADAEWMRSCETIRRISPTVGNLGQWKAFCEGSWSGAVPGDLPLPDNNNMEQLETPSQQTRGPDQDSSTISDGGRDLAVPEYVTSWNPPDQESVSRAVTPSGQSPVPPPQYFPSTPAVEEPPSESHSSPETTTTVNDPKPATTREDRSATIAAFPAPPTHFPIPRAGGSRFNSIVATTPFPAAVDPQPALTPETEGPTPFPRFTDSPISESVASTPALTEDTRSPPTPHTNLHTPAPTALLIPSGDTYESQGDFKLSSAGRDGDMHHPPSSYSQTSHSSHSHTPSRADRTRLDAEKESSPVVELAVALSFTSSSYRRGDYMGDTEFGVGRSDDSPKPRTIEPPLGRIIENDTGKSNGSTVAALRDRYARPGPSSPPPKSPPPRELPRLPTSVSSLANRYEPAGANPGRQQTGSPTRERRRPSVEVYTRMPEPTISTSPIQLNMRYTGADEIFARRQRIEELEELELREREHELRMKEREIEQRARELERERLQLLSVRGGRNEGYINDGTRASGGPRISTTKRPSMDARYSSYSQSTTHLVPPPSSQASSRQPSSQPSSPASQPADYPSYARDRDVSPTLSNARPPESPVMLRPEKPKGGWIRRLSMPVVSNAFSLDSKKNGSNVGIAGGPGYRNSLAFADEDGRLQLHTDLTGGIRNRSTTNVARR